MLRLIVDEEGAQRLTRKHPWLFRRHFSVKRLQAVQPGFSVEVVDEQSRFLAYGVADNEEELVFRAWSFHPEEKDFFSLSFLVRRIVQAWIVRQRLGILGSRRILYSEADGLSGVILDLYELSELGAEVWYFQVSTKAWDYLVSDPSLLITQVVEWLLQDGWIQASDVAKSRAWVVKKTYSESLEHGFTSGSFFDLHQATALVMLPPRPKLTHDKVHLQTDFLRGQKTGLFLDQRDNLAAAAFWVQHLWTQSRVGPSLQTSFLAAPPDRKALKILDLCCYRGAWSCALTQALVGAAAIEVHLVDQSSEALAQARENAINHGATRAEIYLGDVFEVLDRLPDAEFDIVVCDPPAFAKSKKHLSSALRGYKVLNQKALSKLSTPGGFFITASCSRAVSRESFQNLVTEVLQAQSEPMQLVYAGIQALDHRVMAHFPEGEYLKVLMYSR